MTWLKRMIGGNPTPPRPRIIVQDDPRIAAGHAALDAYWSGIGAVDRDVLSYMVNPQFDGAPPWPNMRQAFRVVRRADTLILASDGLSDPFVGTDIMDTSGFGMEVFIELPTLQAMPQDAIMRSAPFALIESIARNVADVGGMVPQLEKHGLLSMEVPLTHDFGPGWTSDDGMAAVLFGVPVPDRLLTLMQPFGIVRMVPVTLLHTSELDYLISGGASARMAVGAALQDAGVGHLCDVSRNAVV
jgi:Suppressor of fused protein (SUFU)